MNEPLDIKCYIQRIAEHIPGMIYQYVLRADGTDDFIYVSPGCRDIYELEPEELLRDFGQVWAMIHPEDLKRVRQINLLSAENLERFDIEFRLLPPSGCVRWVRAISQPERQPNGDVIWDGFVFDISDRIKLANECQQALIALQKSEAKFRLFAEAESSNAVIWISQPTSAENLYVSPAYERIWGRSRQNLSKRPDSWLEAIHPDDRDLVRLKLEQQRQQQSTNLEYRIVHLDGSVHWIWDRSFPICNQAGEFESVGGIAEDITERKQTEVQLQNKQKFIEQINTELEVANEELQCTNEELETTNEELETTNQELNAMNEILRQRTFDLNRANAFLNSILTSLRAGMVVVNPEFCIINWNSEAENLWGLRSKDVQNKSFFSLDIGLPVEELREPIRNCLNRKAEGQQLVIGAINRRGRSIKCRINLNPLIGFNQEQQGVILLMEVIE